MMNVEKMTVEFKEGSKGMKAKRTSRVIPVPLAMREQTKKDLDSTVKMGILEDVLGKANHDLWTTPLGVLSTLAFSTGYVSDPPRQPWIQTAWQLRSLYQNRGKKYSFPALMRGMDITPFHSMTQQRTF